MKLTKKFRKYLTELDQKEWRLNFIIDRLKPLMPRVWVDTSKFIKTKSSKKKVSLSQ